MYFTSTLKRFELQEFLNRLHQCDAKIVTIMSVNESSVQVVYFREDDED